MFVCCFFFFLAGGGCSFISEFKKNLMPRVDYRGLKRSSQSQTYLCYIQGEPVIRGLSIILDCSLSPLQLQPCLYTGFCTCTHTTLHTHNFKIVWSTKRFALFEFIFYFVLTYVYVSSLLLSSENIWQKAVFMRYSMRLECTCIFSLNDFQLVMGLHRSSSYSAAK